MRTRGTHRRAGRAFTLVELQVALVVTGIILAAVVSLGFALNAAQGTTEDLGRRQAVLRHADGRIRQLIQQSNAIVLAEAGGIQLWHDDGADGDPNEPEEQSIIRQNAAGTAVELLTLERASQDGWASGVEEREDWFTIRLGDEVVMVHGLKAVEGFTLKGNAWIDENGDMSYDNDELFLVRQANLVSGCSNIGFLITCPPYKPFVAVQFDLEENGQINTYQIAASLRCRDGHKDL